MTQEKSHRSPLAPGEIRTHVVGDRAFQVMHVAGGSFTQASVNTAPYGRTVLCTDTSADVAVKAYADAIEQAESEQAAASWDEPLPADEAPHPSAAAIDLALDLAEVAGHAASDALEGGDVDMALRILTRGMIRVVETIAPYAGGMPTPYPHVLMFLSNGSTIRTTQNTTADIAGLINAGVAKIYEVQDLDGVTHNVMIGAILDFCEVTA